MSLCESYLFGFLESTSIYFLLITDDSFSAWEEKKTKENRESDCTCTCITEQRFSLATNERLHGIIRCCRHWHQQPLTLASFSILNCMQYTMRKDAITSHIKQDFMSCTVKKWIACNFKNAFSIAAVWQPNMQCYQRKFPVTT